MENFQGRKLYEEIQNVGNIIQLSKQFDFHLVHAVKTIHGRNSGEKW